MAISELTASMDRVVVSNRGYCPCCDSFTMFEARGEYLRDHYFCTRCQSIPRQRALAHVLTKWIPDWIDRSIHESSPTWQFLARRCRDYSVSQYFPDVPLGTPIDGVRCENLEALTFADNRFDVFLTQDVMEHVFDPGAAFREIMRVVKPGGIHLFTVPVSPYLEKSECCARLEGDIMRFLKEPTYHGNPISEQGSLVTWEYGRDFEDRLRDWAGYPTSNFVIRDTDFGLDGELINVFMTKKSFVQPMR